VEGSGQAALEQRECRFNGVRVDITAHVDFRFVLDALMAHVVKLRGLEIVDRAFVGHDRFRVFRDVIRDDLVDRVRFVVRCLHQANGSAAFPNANDYVFVLEFAAMAALLSADIRFVNFHYS